MVLKPCFDHRYVCFKELSRLDRSLALTIVMILFKEPLWPDGGRLKNFREHETPYAFLYLSKLGELITFASLSFPIICDKRMICQFHIFLKFFFSVTSVITNCVFYNFHKFDAYYLPSISLFLLRISVFFIIWIPLPEKHFC